jgi:hypothetical protein
MMLHRRHDSEVPPQTRRQFLCRLSQKLLVCHLVWAAGCQPYQLAGVVLDGPVSAITIVDRSDPRLRQPGIVGATLDLTLDPSTLKPIRVGSTLTNEEGWFSLVVGQVGAGFLEYEAGILCQVNGYGSVYQTLELPHPDKRLLIIVGPGVSGRPRDRNLLKETLELGRQLGQ